MYLELADEPAYLGTANALEYMVQVPNGQGGFMWVREDLLDDISDAELYELLQMQPHLSGIFGKFKSMVGRRKERKQTEKFAKKDKRFERREDKRQTRTDRKGGSFLDRLTGSVQQVVGSLPGKQAPAETRDASDFFPQITGSANVGVAQWWQNPMVIGAGALVVVGGIYLATKKK